MSDKKVEKAMPFSAFNGRGMSGGSKASAMSPAAAPSEQGGMIVRLNNAQNMSSMMSEK